MLEYKEVKMSNKKQSSIEWLYNKMYEHRGNITIEEFEQAKAMHKEEIIDTWYDCKMSVIEKNPTTADQYYNETFGGQDNERNRSIPE